MATTKDSGESASKSLPKEDLQLKDTSDVAKPTEPDETARIAHARAHLASAKALAQLVREFVMAEDDCNRPDTDHLAIALEAAEVHIRQVTDAESNYVNGGHLFADASDSQALAVITLVNAWLSDHGWSCIPDVDRLIAAIGSLEMFIGQCLASIAPTSSAHMGLSPDGMQHPLASLPA